jgi:hypothetical protein
MRIDVRCEGPERYVVSLDFGVEVGGFQTQEDAHSWVLEWCIRQLLAADKRDLRRKAVGAAILDMQSKRRPPS